MEWNDCLITIQKYLKEKPLVILGSGASMSYGLPSMIELSSSIKSDTIVKSDPKYTELCQKIDSLGLENAIDNINISKETNEAIRTVAWKQINGCDLSFFWTKFGKEPNWIAELLKKIICPIPNEAVIVTTNYDRIAEYAADSIRATVITGFEGNLIRKLEMPQRGIAIKRIKARERVVKIWKVHGSVDWFIDQNNEIVSFPLSQSIPTGYEPLIVPPGKDKYSRTHEEPYRTIISEADKAFVKAKSYLCIGYGFNDEHIQPKLLTQIINEKPIVILARTMTEACKRHIINHEVKKYVVLERQDENHTNVYMNGSEGVFDGSYWQLEEFLKLW